MITVGPTGFVGAFVSFQPNAGSFQEGVNDPHDVPNLEV